MSRSLTGIDTTSSISRHASATSSNTCALRTTRGGCCTGISLLTDGCAVQIPSAPLGHCLPAENAVPSAELVVGFVQTVYLRIAPHSVFRHLSISIPVQTLAAKMQHLSVMRASANFLRLIGAFPSGMT